MTSYDDTTSLQARYSSAALLGSLWSPAYYASVHCAAFHIAAIYASSSSMLIFAAGISMMVCLAAPYFLTRNGLTRRLNMISEGLICTGSSIPAFIVAAGSPLFRSLDGFGYPLEIGAILFAVATLPSLLVGVGVASSLAGTGRWKYGLSIQRFIAIELLSSLPGLLLVYLFPGSGRSLMAVAGLMGVVNLIRLIRSRRWIWSLFAMTITGGAWLFGWNCIDDTRRSGVEEFSSGFGVELRYVSSNESRYLLRNGLIAGVVDSVAGESRDPYVSMMELPMYLEPTGRVLLCGLNTGVLGRTYASFGWSVTVSDPDANLRWAHKHSLSSDLPVQNIVLQTGREALQNSAGRYDVILVDEWTASSQSVSLLASEGIQLLKTRLNPGGVAAFNVEAIGWDDPLVRVVAATLKEHFSFVVALPEAEPPSEYGNIVLIASDSALVLRQELPRNSLDSSYRFSGSYWKVHGWDNQFAPDISGISPATDGSDPIPRLREPIDRAARRELHHYVSPAQILW